MLDPGLWKAEPSVSRLTRVETRRRDVTRSESSMHPQAKEAVIERLDFVAKNLVNPLDGTKHQTYRKSAGSFTMTEDAWGEFNKLLKKLLDGEKWAAKFSETYLSSKLNDILHNALGPDAPSIIARQFEELVGEFVCFAQERVVFIPLAGIKMHLEQLPIGRVVLRNLTGDQAERLTGRVRLIVMQTGHTEEQKESIFKQFDEKYVTKVRGRVCSEFTVVAESRRAKELAEEETRRALDLLRFSIPCLYGDRRVMIGLQGEACEDGRSTVSITTDNTKLDVGGEVVYHPFEITQQAVDAMRSIGVFEVASLLEKPTHQATEFERAILRAVHWVADAQAQVEKENSLLSLVTCLETFLTPRNRDPISAAIAEGVAILVGDGLEKRKRIKQRVREFYRLRSAFSHGGHGEILDADLGELREIAGELTVQMIRRRNEFRSVQSLLDWLEDQKLGGS
jgi:hypothetical protein